MTFAVSPVIGVNTNQTWPAANYTVAPFNLGEQVWGADGKRYVFAQASGSISASTAVCTVNAGTFLATNSGGSYTSPNVAMVNGDWGWFGAASV